MKYKITIITITALAFMFFSACQDFLDLKPLDQEVTSNFYQTEADAMQALVAVYDVLTYQTHPTTAWAPMPTVADILSDDAFAGGSDANDGYDENQLNTHRILTTNPVVHTLWITPYIGIYRANVYLEVIEDIDAPDDFKTRTIAEVKFLRAYFYFNLVRFFENVPLLTTTISGPSEYAQEQNSPQEVYNQIALDLEEAMKDLPESVTAAEAGRITKWAAQALLARVYLFYNGMYNAELDAGGKQINASVLVGYLDELINISGHDLFDDYRDNFSLAGEFGVESVFEISYGDTPPWWDWGYPRGGHGNLAAQMQGPRVTGSQNWNRGWSFGTVSHKLAQDLEGDPRFEYTILTEEELDGTLVKGYQHTGYFSKKYSSDAEHWGSDGQFELNRTCNYRVIRFSDVLLMAAELGSANAQDYLDRVRGRFELPSVPATKENILRERRLELSLEGSRYFDLLRTGNTQELTHSTMGPNYEAEAQVYEVNYTGATRGFLPIPQSEIDLSSGLFKQNSGY